MYDGPSDATRKVNFERLNAGCIKLILVVVARTEAFARLRVGYPRLPQVGPKVNVQDSVKQPLIRCW